MRFDFLVVTLSSLTSVTIAASPTQDNPRGQSLNPRLAALPLGPRNLPIGTCNENTPCSNKACCSKKGLCGYSPDFCGDGCTSNCDAKAQCGPYAAKGQQKCPLNVCCSEFGYCGSTSEFCTWKGCDTKYGGCGDAPRPSCSGGTSVSKRTVGYYESWSNTRKCQTVSPELLNLDGFTHINFAFSFFDPSSFEISPMDANGGSLYSRFTALKDRQRELQTWISVGGWSFTDPGPTRQAFSDMVSTAGNRQKFINGLIKFMDTYGFDGVDLDWEYPGADDRGGKSSDSSNYVLLAQELKAAFGSKYGISMTLPTSFWYLQHFDVKSLQGSIDWFNLMAYDLHGTWDADSKFVGPYIAPHTNITEIDLGLDLLWRAGVTPDKVVMGEGWYGRSFTLKNPICSNPNGECQFSGPAMPGPCSNAAGILDNQEIQDIISKNNLKPVYDKMAGVKWITWDSNQWVSYDDEETLAKKKDFANSRCLGGLMVWAMDQIDQTAPNGLVLTPGITKSQQDDANQQSSDLVAGITCYTADCGEKCKKGTNPVSKMSGQPGQLSTSSRCPKGKYQSLCCDDGTTMGKCQWRGYRGVGLSCTSGCADGETEIVENTNNHGKKDQTCNGGLQSYCCAGFKSAPTKAQLEQQAADAAKAAAETAAANAALDVAAKAFCRVAVPALLAPLELLEDAIPIIGEIADLAEIAATPAIIRECVKGVEKEGKAEFKVFGKKHTLDINKPTETPIDPRPPRKTHEPPSTKSKPSKTQDHHSKTAHHSTTRSPSASASREPYRCLKNKCGESCDLKRFVSSEESSDGALARRFYPVNQDGDVEKLRNKKGNRDISSFKNRATGWIPFDGTNQKSVTIVGLEGCTVIAAMSNAGMIASHIFEDGPMIDDSRKDIANTLNPPVFEETLAAVKADIQSKLAAHPEALKNGQLLVMLPKNPDQPEAWLYDTETWEEVDKDGKMTKGTTSRKNMAADIRKMAEEATGLTDTKVVSYIPPKDDAQALKWENSWHGTFAVQYDPNYQPGQQARQIWCENKPAWPQPLTWPSSG